MLDRVHKVSEIVAAFSIVASLIFVGIQVSQNTDALETNAAQINSQSWQNITLAIATNPQLAAAYQNSFSDSYQNSDPAQSGEDLQVSNLIQTQLKSMEFNYLQWRDGKLSDEIFAPTRAAYLFLMTNNPVLEQFVTQEDTLFTASFATFSKEVQTEAAKVWAEEVAAAK
jgi:hypothetical protein